MKLSLVLVLVNTSAREDSGIELNKGKASGKALFVIDGDDADFFILWIRVERCLLLIKMIKVLKSFS